MNKFFVFTLVAASLFVSLSLSSKTTAGKNHPAFITPTPTPFPAEIQSVELEKDEIIARCPPKSYPHDCRGSLCDDDPSIQITATAKNPQNTEINYYYTISGGRIVGQGNRIRWDLKEVRPGTYTVTAQVGDGVAFSEKTITKTIQVRGCDCCMPICSCPTLDVSGGGIIRAGETMTFEANVSGGSQTEVTYNWTVSQGEIIEGQGTSKIKVKTSSGMSGNVTATVKIDGSDLCSECPKEDSETGGIEK